MSNFIPNSFQLPNAFVDEAMKKLSPTANMLYIVIVRKTRGWQKNKDAISLTQFEEITGLSRKTVIKATNELIEFGFVKEYAQKNAKAAKSYALNDGVFSTLVESPLVENLHRTSGKNPPVTSGKIPHTKTTIKTTNPKQGVYSEDFEKFWESYPRCKRKSDKSGTFKTFEKYKSVVTTETLIKILNAQKQDQSWIKQDGEFIPAPTAWLNQKNWENDYWTTQAPVFSQPAPNPQNLQADMGDW
ncbi:replication protein [Acinetobacter sp. RF14B]|uniref:replication protein n=1 Tax=Acinetobacter sp. RF14B TaxID=2650965 RepID=UPI001166EEF9|nr:replication protein [Acinetobacter sp. RF14B]TQR66840.1 hypothetical protein E2K52_05480 [Acinetobacter sp. RF14B]